MISSLPEPPIPPEVDMGANAFFPFYFDRLRKSKWWRRASDVARARNVMMWGEAYKSRPAGSLPDDDDELAEAAGYGLNVEAFLEHKTEIMAPWTLCADGRWYHPTVCEVVLETWGKMSERRRQERERKADYRRRTRPGCASDAPRAPSDAPSDAPSNPRVGPVGHPPLSRGTPPLVPREVATEERRGEDTNTVASAPRNATGSSSDGPTPWKADPQFLTVWDASTPEMRRRAKSMAKAWAEWRKVRKTAPAEHVLAGLRGYLASDPDVKRTGGPGLHIWLRDRTFEQWNTLAQAGPSWSPEQWRSAVEIWRESGRWSDTLGPCPGEPGCRAPPTILAQAGLGLRVVQGGAA